MRFIYLLFFLSFNLVLCQDCDSILNDYDYYSIKKIVTKKQFKKESFEDINLLKSDLVKQISTSISVSSTLIEFNEITGNKGNYYESVFEESLINSLGIVNNPELLYCKSNKKYFVIFRVPVNEFENDLYSELLYRSHNAVANLQSIISNINSIGKLTSNVNELKKELYYIINGASIISSSSVIDQTRKDLLSLTVRSSIKLFNSIEAVSIISFDTTLRTLNRLLNESYFSTINEELQMIDATKLTSGQKMSLNNFTKDFYLHLEAHKKNIENQIEKSIRKKEINQCNEALVLYSKISFYKDVRVKYEKYKRQLSMKVGLARTNLSFGINVGSSFTPFQTSEAYDLGSVQKSINLNQLLPSFDVGFKHYFFDPKKRFGVAVKYKSYNNLIENNDNTELTENPFINFNATQFGVSVDFLDLYYGPVKGLDIEGDFSLFSLNISILRTDKSYYNNPGKNNFLSLYAYSDFMTNMKEESFFQFGIGLSYSFIFNRTNKYD
tara:strand:+ start:977 stop:2467 length:1491 start_codon:yes stop_codon:yes gene_type:complete